MARRFAVTMAVACCAVGSTFNDFAHAAQSLKTDDCSADVAGLELQPNAASALFAASSRPTLVGNSSAATAKLVLFHDGGRGLGVDTPWSAHVSPYLLESGHSMLDTRKLGEISHFIFLKNLALFRMFRSLQTKLPCAHAGSECTYVTVQMFDCNPGNPEGHADAARVCTDNGFGPNTPSLPRILYFRQTTASSVDLPGITEYYGDRTQEDIIEFAKRLDPSSFDVPAYGKIGQRHFVEDLVALAHQRQPSMGIFVMVVDASDTGPIATCSRDAFVSVAHRFEARNTFGILECGGDAGQNCPSLPATISRVFGFTDMVERGRPDYVGMVIRSLPAVLIVSAEGGVVPLIHHTDGECLSAEFLANTVEKNGFAMLTRLTLDTQSRFIQEVRRAGKKLALISTGPTTPRWLERVVLGSPSGGADLAFSNFNNMRGGSAAGGMIFATIDITQPSITAWQDLNYGRPMSDAYTCMAADAFNFCQYPGFDGSKEETWAGMMNVLHLDLTSCEFLFAECKVATSYNARQTAANMLWFLNEGWKPDSGYVMHNGYSDDWPHWWDDASANEVRTCKRNGMPAHDQHGNPRFSDMAMDLTYRHEDGLCDLEEESPRLDIQRCYGEDWRSLAESYELFVDKTFQAGGITEFMGQPSAEIWLDSPVLAAHHWTPMKHDDVDAEDDHRSRGTRILESCKRGNAAEMVQILQEDLPFSPDDVDVHGEGEHDFALYCVLARRGLYAAREPGRPTLDGTQDKLANTPPNWPEGRQGNAAIARLLFTSGAVTTKDAPPLVYLAAFSGDVDGLTVLMQAGVDPDSPSASHPEGADRPLFVASIAIFVGRSDSSTDRQLAVMEVLLQHGADVDYVTAEIGEQTLLEAAVLRSTASTLRLVKLLIKYNATIETRSTDFDDQAYADATPLMLAAGRGNYKAANALLNAGASAELTDANGRTPLMLAVGHLYHLDSDYTQDQTDRTGQETILEDRRKRLVHSLRAAALIAETKTGKESMEARDDLGQTALALALVSPTHADDSKHRALKLLLALGANPNGWHLIGPNGIDRDPNEAVTPLMMVAVWCGMPKPTPEGLLELAGGYVPDGELLPGQTVIQYFEQWLPVMMQQHSTLYSTMAKILLEAGADAMMQNHENKTAIDLAEEHGHRELAQLMRASLSGLDESTGSGSGHSRGQRVLESCFQGDAAEMVRILDEGLPFASDDIDVRGEGEYDTALSCVLMLNKLYAPRENFRDDWKLAVPPLNWPEGRQGNAAIARLLFTSGAITTKDAPPLAMMTVSHGDTDGLAVLMEAGVDPDSSTALVNTTSDRPYFVGTALHLGAGRLFAASKHKMVVDEQLAVIEVLLQYGADVDNVAGHPDFTAEEVVAQQSHIQHTALEAAVLENGPSSLRLLKLLLRHNATVDTRSMDLVAGSFENATPLMLAAGRGNVKAVSALLKADASAELTDARGRTPLILAVSLVYLRAPDLEHAGHGTDLEIATRVIEYKLAIVDGLRAATLIAKTATGQASFSHRDDDRGWTALTHTMAPMRAQRGMTKLDDGVDDISHRALKMLLRHGANPNDWHLIGPNDIGKDPDEAVTPLMMAALWCGLRVPSAQEMRDELPDGSIAESAIEEDVAEWFEQMHQNTLLGQHDRHKTMVQILLEAGADAMMQNHENKTAIDLAEEHDHRELAQLMRASLSGLDGSTGSGSGRYKSDDDLSAAVSQGVSQDAIRSLLYNGARADAFNSGGTTALMVAVSIGRTDAARVLLDTGRADPDVLSRMSFTSKQHIKSDITALIMAASQGDAEMTKALLAQGQQ